MTDKEIILKIATLRGWETKDCNTGLGTEGMIRIMDPERSSRMYWPGCQLDHSTFNPLENIADAWELEGSLAEMTRPNYMGYLESICVDAEFNECDRFHQWAVHRATPRQRCLAYLAAHGVEG